MSGEEHRHRRAERLGRGRRSDRAREVPGPAPCPEGVRPTRAEHQQPGRGEHRQQEAEGACQVGVEEDQQQGRAGQRGQRPARTAGGQRQQPDQPGARRSEHAGLGAADRDEGQRHGRPHQRRGAQRDPEQGGESAPLGSAGTPRGADQHPEHDREVGPADRHQVGQVGVPERLPEVVRQPGGVAHDEAREQSALVRRQAVGGGAQSRPEPSGDPLREARRRRRAGLAVRDQQRRRLVVALPRWPDGHLCHQPDRRQQGLPGGHVLAAHQDGDGCAGPDAARARLAPQQAVGDGDAVHDRLHGEQTLPGAGSATAGDPDPRVPGDGEVDAHLRGRAAGPGQFGQRSTAQIGGVQEGGGCGGGRGEQDDRRGHGDGATPGRTGERPDPEDEEDQTEKCRRARRRGEGRAVAGPRPENAGRHRPGGTCGQQQSKVTRPWSGGGAGSGLRAGGGGEEGGDDGTSFRRSEEKRRGAERGGPGRTGEPAARPRRADLRERPVRG